MILLQVFQTDFQVEFASAGDDVLTRFLNGDLSRDNSVWFTSAF